MRKEPLFRLAEKKRLPAHQFIDGATLRWMVKNRPKFATTKKVKLPSRAMVERFNPPKTWFLKPIGFDSIHGVRHLLRVAIHAYLVLRSSRSKEKLENVLVASILHDIRRKNDKGDPEHGMRAAQWFKKNHFRVGKKLGVSFRKDDIDGVFWAIAFHERDHFELKTKKPYRKFKGIIDILKIADALDRYRLPKKKWWLNENTLGVKVPKTLQRNAFALTLKSERKFLLTKNSPRSILNLLPQ